MEITWLTDEDGEEFVFENEWDIAIPVDLLLDGERLRITCFPCTENAVREWYERGWSDVFSESALRALTEVIIPILEEHHYVPEPKRHRWGYLMRCETPQKTVAPSNIVHLSSEDEKRNLTSYDIEASLAEGCVGFGALEDGRIVSLAMTHSSPEESAEIGVETVKAYRGKGYASHCLSALTVVRKTAVFRMESRTVEENR